MNAKSLKFSVAAKSESPTKLMVSVREFSFAIDEPESLGGTNAGPNPVELVLASLAGCINIVIHMVAAEQGIVIRGLRLTVEGDLDPSLLMGSPTDERAGFSAIALTAEVDSDASAEEIDEVLRIAETRCPVADNLNSATPVTLQQALTPVSTLA
ncbi:MAG: OsmC family protein [Cellulomonas sp.]